MKLSTKQLFAIASLTLAGGGYTAYLNIPTSAPPANVITVTSLADYKPWDLPVKGTLRAAIAAAKPGTTIAFAVAGDIALAEQLTLASPSVVIDGSTAPSPGITITRNQFTVKNTKYVLLKNLRFQAGDGYATETERKAVHGQYDSYIDVAGRANESDTGGVRSLVIFTENGGSCTDITVDHCTIADSTDDNAGVWGDCRRINFSYCLIYGGYANVFIRDQVVNSSKGLLAGVEPGKTVMNFPDYLTIDHCCFAFMSGRCPDLNGGVVKLTNNVICASYQGGRITSAKADIIGNWFMSRKNHGWGAGADRQLVADSANAAAGSYFVANNYLDGVASNAVLGELNKGQADLPTRLFRAAPWSSEPVKERIVSATEAMKDVLVNVGCTSPVRNKSDQAVIDSVASQISK